MAADGARGADASSTEAVAAKGLTGPLWGATFMLLATTCFAGMAVFIRLLKDDQTSIDIVFWRSLFGSAMMLPFMLGGIRSGSFKTGKIGLLGLRSFLTYLATISFFYAIANINLVDAVALNATIPLFTALLAALILPEVVGMRRWVATLIGFGGALIVLRPGFQEIGLPAVGAVVSAFFYACASIVVKILARTESATTVVFYMNLILVAIATIPWAIHWNLPKSNEAWIYLLGVASCGTLAHVFITRALAAADASFCAPFDFNRLFLVTVAGWLIFGDPGTIWTWIGGVVIFAAAAYVTRREALARRVAAT